MHRGAVQIQRIGAPQSKRLATRRNESNCGRNSQDWVRGSGRLGNNFPCRLNAARHRGKLLPPGIIRDGLRFTCSFSEWWGSHASLESHCDGFQVCAADARCIELGGITSNG
jgi:hypothetical protein